MGLLGDLYSTIDTGKRKLKGLLGDPVGTLQDYVFNLNEDAGKGLGLLAMSGSPTKPPNAQEQAARNALIDNLGPAMMGATVWHGSPHVFDRFDASKIGTGEGAQAYGHGLYLAESPAVAKEYQTKLSKNVTVDGKKLTTVPSDGPSAQAHNSVVTRVQDGLNPSDAISAAVKYWDDAANEMMGFMQANPQLADRIKQEAASRAAIAREAEKLNPSSFFMDPGALYKVDLPDSAISKMLNYDAPVGDAMRRPLSDAAMRDFGSGVTDTSGEHLYKEIIFNFKNAGHPNPTQAATDWLSTNGVPGIRYLDGGSRGAGAGTSNYVVFPGNESLLQILERNGQPMGGY